MGAVTTGGNRRAMTRALSVIGALLGLAAPAAAQEPAYSEAYRPQFHFTPAQNWMNDPNGLVYYDGEYHMFYQYNPNGITWGDMSWGHSVSRDLLHWDELPVALTAEKDANGNLTQMFFSGARIGGSICTSLTW